jgi:tRNA(Arg) A34 adenosine deaminase TadA
MSDAARHTHLLELAGTIALEGVRSNIGGPFGAIVARGSDVIARGTNRVTSSNDPTAHAEIVAIREACTALKRFDLAGCTLYTSCEPCPMCLGGIYWARLDAVYYANSRGDAAAIGFDDDHIYREFALPIARRAIPFTQLASSTARAAFAAWDAKPDKVRY